MIKRIIKFLKATSKVSLKRLRTKRNIKEQCQRWKFFVKFSGDIRERDDRTPNMAWMQKICKQLKEKNTSVKEF